MRFRLQTMICCIAVVLALGSYFAIASLAVEADQPAAGGGVIKSPSAISSMVQFIRVGGPPNVHIRTVSGKATIDAMVSPSVKPTAVNCYADGNALGSMTARPFRYEWDTTKVPDGEHTVRTVAVDAEGKELWAGETKVIIANKADAAPPKSKPSPAATAPPTLPAKAPSKVAAPPKGTRAMPSIIMAPKSEIFKSRRYKFQLSYPTGWVFTDRTNKMKPAWPGGFWFVFSRGSLKKADMVVNVRRRTEPAPTTADAFAQQPENAYVNSWRREPVMGRTAFRTTQGNPSSKRVIHRCLVVDGANIWMLNCIDTSGGPADKSKAYFDLVVNSITPFTPDLP